MKPETSIETRVRYVDCDPMGYAHHSVYPVWFEMARTELLRRIGTPYAELEQRGLLIVVVKLDVRFHRPARYDDLLSITATTTRSAGVRIEHTYEVRRGTDRLTTGVTTLACINRDGRVQPVPEALRYDPDKAQGSL